MLAPCIFRVLGNFLVPIVLLGCCPLRCYVAELKNLEGCIVHVISWSIARQHDVIVLGPVSSITATLQISGFLLLFSPLQQLDDYLCIQYEVNGKAVLMMMSLHSTTRVPHSQPIPSALNLFYIRT